MTAPRPVRRLPDALVNKIAAGEVVERPASVVKELVENSLDADATRITVTLQGAGRQLVSVVDDGHGMSPEDCHLALERHATSKLRDEADLGAIVTLGFRGEALPAIFAVSRLTLASRERISARGYRVAGEGGEIHDAAALDVPEGTALTVRDLFFNTPARARFLKSPPTEQGAILRALTALVLAHPGVHLRMLSNGRVVLNAPASRTPRERLGHLYGFGVADRLLEVSGEAGGARVSGLVAPPALSRTHRDDIHLVVNGRAVRDTLLGQALVEAYRPLLPRDRYPLALLSLEVEPGHVDVNVHPTKAWVRFRQARVVHDLVYESVRRALRLLEATPGGLTAAVLGAGGPLWAPAAGAGGLGAGAGPAAPAGGDGQGALFREDEAGYRTEGLFGALVGQVEDTFIVSHTAEEVFFVDQHVAHERVLFERLQTALDSGPLPAQTLLFPQPLELAPVRQRAIERVAPELQRLGFSMEGFGEGAVLVRAVPSLLRGDEPVRLIDDLAREIEEDGRRDGSPILDRLLAFVACRAAVKAHHPLEREEMARLLGDLALTATPYFCPHGRPIVSRIALRDIRQELRRDWS